MKKMKTSSKRKIGLPTILPDLICFTVKKQRNGLVNYQLFNVALRISAGPRWNLLRNMSEISKLYITLEGETLLIGSLGL